MADPWAEVFTNMRKRNKIMFTLVAAVSIILFWKGVWGLSEIIFDEWLFQNHLFWSNLAATAVGLFVLSGAGILLEKLA